METGIIVGQIFKTLWEAIRELEATDQAEIYNAIFQYQFLGEVPKFKNKLLEVLFKSHLPTLDKFISNQKAKIENGKKGGRPKTEITEVKLSKAKTTEKKLIKPNLPIVETKTTTTQAQVYGYFAELYKKHTKIEYLSKKIDFINLAKLIKQYGVELVKQKIDWLLTGCLNSVFWFSKDINDFTISTLYTQWNYILPKLTEEQKREQQKKKKEEEQKRRILEQLEKQGIVLEGGNNVNRLQ